MHILFITEYFPPEIEAPASRTFEHCRQWVASGCKVTVITGAPNFPKGHIFRGYRNKLWQRESMEGINLIRVWTYITAHEGFVRRILDYLSFMMTSIIAGLFVRNVDMVVGTSPPIFTGCAAWIIGTLKRKPWVLELRDIWPESIKAVGAMKDASVIWLFEHIERFLYRQASGIIALTHSFKKILIQRGINGAKITVVTNGVDFERFKPQPKDVRLIHKLALEGCFIAGYIGTHGMAHSLETLLDAAEILQNMPEASNIRMLFLGQGTKKAELMASSRGRGLQNVLFLEPVSRGQVARYWSILDLSIIHLRDADLFNSVIPSKLFECMRMGIPILHGVPGESAEIVRREQVGRIFTACNPLNLVQTLLSMAADKDRLVYYRQNGLLAANHYNRNALAAKMLDVLKHLKQT